MPSKSQSLAVASVSAVVMFCMAMIGLPLIAWAAVVVCVISLLWYSYRRWYHARLLSAAQAGAQQALPPVVTMTSPGSSRLFVPSPLDRR